MNGAPIVDQCASCQSEQRTAAAEERRRAEEPYAEARRQIETARATLVLNGAPGRAPRRRISGSKRTLFGVRWNYREEEPAWPVGLITVEVAEGHSHVGYETSVECGVTRDGDIVVMDPIPGGTPSQLGSLSLFELQQIAASLQRIVATVPN